MPANTEEPASEEPANKEPVNKVPGIVVAETESARWYERRPVQWAAIACAVGLLCGGIYWYAANRTVAPPPQKKVVTKPEPKTVKQPSSIEKAYSRGDYQAAAKELESAAPTDYDNQRKLAIAYENAKEYQKALGVYETLEKAGQLKAAYTFRAAEVARLGGNKEVAVGYYKLAKQRYTEEGGARVESRVARIDEALKGLGVQ